MQGDRESFRAFLEATRSLRTVEKIMRKLSVLRAVRRRSWRIRRGYARLTGRTLLLQTYFSYAARARQVERLAEKTPIHGTFVPEITATFPDAVMVWIHRHPLDVYSSYVRRGRTEVEKSMSTRDENRWLKVDAATFCRRHRERIACLREALVRRPLPIKVIGYEEFVQAPHSVFRDLCDFLGEPYEPACVEGKAEEINDPRDPLLSRPIVRATKSWRDFLSVDECRRIEDTLRDDMEFLGYRPRVADWR
jgi:hypothetical protein